MKHLIAPLAALLILFPTIAFAAEECPIESLAHDDIKQGIAAAPSCAAAWKMFQLCNVGTSGDIRIGAVVTEKCEAVFKGKLTAQQKNAYAHATHVCDTKYRNESGTMYRSFEALCRAEAAYKVAKPFARPASRVSTGAGATK